MVKTIQFHERHSWLNTVEGMLNINDFPLRRHGYVFFPVVQCCIHSDFMDLEDNLSP